MGPEAYTEIQPKYGGNEIKYVGDSLQSTDRHKKLGLMHTVFIHTH